MQSLEDMQQEAAETGTTNLGMWTKMFSSQVSIALIREAQSALATKCHFDPAIQAFVISGRPFSFYDASNRIQLDQLEQIIGKRSKQVISPPPLYFLHVASFLKLATVLSRNTTCSLTPFCTDSVLSWLV